jgi:PTH1 family peptidyl-tRNA hydrolase
LWALVGLGNPGRKYARTRHNVGFRVLDELARRLGLTFTEKDLCLFARGSLDGVETVLVEPLTFMNRSGLAVRRVLRQEGIPPTRTVLVHDDLDLETGRVKVKPGGGAGGHRGVESVIREVGSPDFIHVKVGIGRDPDIPPEEYVLRPFGGGERALVDEAVATAADAVGDVVLRGPERAMSLYNRR